jgi:hypothetical protein
MTVIDSQIQKAHFQQDAREDRDGPIIVAALGALPGELQLAAAGLSGLLMALPGTAIPSSAAASSTAGFWKLSLRYLACAP